MAGAARAAKAASRGGVSRCSPAVEPSSGWIFRSLGRGSASRGQLEGSRASRVSRLDVLALGERVVQLGVRARVDVDADRLADLLHARLGMPLPPLQEGLDEVQRLGSGEGEACEREEARLGSPTGGERAEGPDGCAQRRTSRVCRWRRVGVCVSVRGA